MRIVVCNLKSYDLFIICKDPEGLLGQRQTGHIARREFKRRLEKDSEAREAFERQVREEKDRREALRQVIRQIGFLFEVLVLLFMWDLMI